MIIYFIFLLLAYQLLEFIIISLVDLIKYKVSINEFIQRFSIYPSKLQKDILLYGVSCGETILLKPLCEELEKKNKTYITCSQTLSSYRLNKFSKYKILLPFDNLITMFFLFYKISPKYVIISERDTRFFFILWTKLFRSKIYFINYEKKIKKYFSIMDNFHYLISDLIFLKEDTANFDKYIFIDNLKWLSRSSTDIIKLNKLTIVIASANKEEIDLHIKFIKEFNNYKIIYVPRYLNWEDLLRSKLTDINYFWLTKNSQLELIESNNLTIVWSYGLLLKLFSMSHICLMGNTFFSKKGGHNLVEPAVNANSIILGPDYATCKDLADSLNITYCNNYSDLVIKTRNLINSNEYINQGIVNKNITLNKQKLIKQKLINIIDLFI